MSGNRRRGGWIAVGVAAFAYALTIAPGASAGELASRVWAVLRGQPGAGAVTQREAELGLRAALGLAAREATQRLASGDQLAPGGSRRIRLPEALATAQENLRPFGRAQPLDDAEAALNAAAVAAMPALREALLAEIETLTLPDALALIRSEPHGATDYLRLRRADALASVIRPAVDVALSQSAAVDVLANAARAAGLGGRVESLRAQLLDHAIRATLNAGFAEMAAVEREIRADPARYAQPIVTRAFAAQ